MDALNAFQATYLAQQDNALFATFISPTAIRVRHTMEAVHNVISLTELILQEGVPRVYLFTKTVLSAQPTMEVASYA